MHIQEGEKADGSDNEITYEYQQGNFYQVELLDNALSFVEAKENSDDKHKIDKMIKKIYHYLRTVEKYKLEENMGNNIIDSIIIGNNEMNFKQYEQTMRMTGENSSTYKYFALNFVQYQGVKYTLPDLYNKLCEEKNKNNALGKFSLGNMFSNTIAYLGSFFHRRGISFDFVNSFQDEKEKLKELLLNNEVLTITLTTTLYVSVFPVLEIIYFIRKYNPKCKIIVGGPYIATQANSLDSQSMELLMKTLKADFYINSSQGENSLVQIIQAVKENTGFDHIHNIYYKDGNDYTATKVESERNSLDENYVDWSIFKDKISTFAMVRTAISCAFSCAYCEYPQHAGKYETMDIANVEKELDGLESLGTIKSINFVDDTFNIPKERFKDILRLMIRKKYHFNWNSFLRCQFLDEEMVQLMAESGCEAVYLGIESANPEMLINMNKRAKVEDYRRGIALLKKYNIKIVASFMVGFPGDTVESVNETIKFINETKPDFIRLHLWYCSDLTPIFQKKDEFAIEGSQFNWKHKTMDSNQACELVYHMLNSVEHSVFIPQHCFDSIGVMNLKYRDMSMDQIKQFITLFDEGLKCKDFESGNYEISSEVIEKMKELI